MFTSIRCVFSMTKSRIKNLPFLSEMIISTLKSNFGLIRIIAPLLCEEPWLKKAFPPHLASQICVQFLELYVSCKNAN